jgi:hypothetical protein
MVFLKIDLLRDLAAGVYMSEAPSPPRFLLGVFGVYTMYNSCICSPQTPIPPHYTLYKYIDHAYSHREGEEVNQ